jgi:hypothetical protein
MKELERHIKKHYNSESLSKDQLNLIVNQSSSKRSLLRRLPNLVKYAAILVMVIGVVYSLFLLPKHKQTSIVTAFAEEIAFNHQKQLPPDLKTSNLFELNSKMSKLDFDLFLPKNITTNYKLQGGRYCSVGNRIAAQLKLKDSAGKMVTCYVFKKLENFNFEHQIISNSILVDIWDNGILIFAIATD